MADKNPPPRNRDEPAPFPTEGDPPELDNPEQDDEEAQAQSVSEEAYRGSDLGLGDTEKVPTGEEGDDVQDLVDHMRQMDSSGLIDMSAFAGERNDDEEEGRYGNAAEEE